MRFRLKTHRETHIKRRKEVKWQKVSVGVTLGGKNTNLSERVYNLLSLKSQVIFGYNTKEQRIVHGVFDDNKSSDECEVQFNVYSKRWLEQ